MIKKTSAALAAVLIAASISGCAVTERIAVGDCVNVLVDYSSLAQGQNKNVCVPVEGEQPALDVVSQAGLSIAGTDKYGLKVVCRVNDLPSATLPIGIKDHESYVEPCKDMGPEFAYWALLVKSPGQDWDWAQVGIADLTVVAGDSIGLVFSENGNVNFPR